jgi:ketosteroid isomerase-like protein
MDTKASAINVWRAFASRDRSTIESVLAEDVEWIAPPRNATAVALGVSDHMVGPSAIADFILRDFRRMFPNGIQIEPVSITAEGDRVVFEQRQIAVLANGRHYDLAYVFIIEMSSGKARRIREYMDTYNGHRMVFGGEPPGVLFG